MIYGICIANFMFQDVFFKSEVCVFMWEPSNSSWFHINVKVDWNLWEKELEEIRVRASFRLFRKGGSPCIFDVQ